MRALLPAYERVLDEDDEMYHSSLQEASSSSSDLIEMKHFIVVKLVELTPYCTSESTMLRLVALFDKIMNMERRSSIDLVCTSSGGAGGAVTGSACYLSKLVNAGLIDLFEKHMAATANPLGGGAAFSLCCVRIFNILVDYVEKYYALVGHYHQKPQQPQQPQQQQQQPATATLTRRHSSSLAPLIVMPLSGSVGLGGSGELLNQAHLVAKYFNYYASIRKDILEFLLRIRSDKYRRLLLIARTNRRKYQTSQHLLLTIADTNDDEESVTTKA